MGVLRLKNMLDSLKKCELLSGKNSAEKKHGLQKTKVIDFN